jgi:hypothetical protein
MLGFLRRWAYDHDVPFNLFNTTKSLSDRLESLNKLLNCDIATSGNTGSGG